MPSDIPCVEEESLKCRLHLSNSFPLHKSTSILVILDSFNIFRGKRFSLQKPYRKKFQDSDQGWGVAKSEGNFHDPSSDFIRYEDQEHCSVSQARRLQCATWYYLEKTSASAEASHLSEDEARSFLEHMQILLRDYCFIKKWADLPMAGHENLNRGILSLTTYFVGDLKRCVLQTRMFSLLPKTLTFKRISIFLLPSLRTVVAFPRLF
jgi:hypothetical protein